jgi:pyrroloquinoline quinone biosynthesis protein D
MSTSDRATFGSDDVPALCSRYRFQWEPAQQAHVLLYPEGMVKLSNSAAEIVKRVDGAASVGAILADLERAFPGAELRSDVMEFLEIARERGWIEIQTR